MIKGERIAYLAMSGTLSHLGVASAVIAGGAAVEAILGFGCNIVWMGFFPLFTTVRESVGVHQPLGMGLNVLILCRTWRHCKPSELKPLAFTVPLGIGVGLWAVTSWPVRLINALLGMFLLGYTALGNKDKKKSEEALKEEKEDAGVHNTVDGLSSPRAVPLSVEPADTEEGYHDENDTDAAEEELARPLAQSTTAESMDAWRDIGFNPIANIVLNPQRAAAGFFGGCLTSAFGTGGPAILVYAREAGWQSHPDMFRANLQLIFFIMHILAISSMIYGGVVTAETAKASAGLFPAVVAGGLAGNKLAARVPKDVFQKLVINGLRVMGVLFVGKSVL